MCSTMPKVVYFLPDILLFPCTYLFAEGWKGTALVGEGGVINNVPVKHIELTVGHRILTRNRTCINNIFHEWARWNSKLVQFIINWSLPGSSEWRLLVNSDVKCPTKSLWTGSGESPLSQSYLHKTEVEEQRKSRKNIYIICPLLIHRTDVLLKLYWNKWYIKWLQRQRCDIISNLCDRFVQFENSSSPYNRFKEST